MGRRREESDFDAFIADPGVGPARVGAERAPEPLPPVLERTIARELVRSEGALWLRYFLASIAGYGLSLMVCAQKSLGILPVADSVADVLHRLPVPVCALLCGTLFTAIPTGFAGLFLTRFQHRYLLRRLSGWVALVPLLGVSVILLFPHGAASGGSTGHQGHAAHAIASEHAGTGIFWGEASWVLLWSAAALATPLLIEGLCYLVLRQRAFITRARD